MSEIIKTGLAAGEIPTELAHATPPPSGDLVERIQSWCTDYRFYGEEMDSIHKEAYNLFAECLTALQGVTISRECAENSLNVVRSVLEDSEEQIRKLGLFKQRSARTKYRSVLKVIEATENELAKALEHSNGR